MRKAIAAAGEGLEDAIDEWVEEGETKARAAIMRGESRRGYALNTLYEQTKGEKLGEKSGRIVSEPFYARFFEYGTYGGAGIEPMPFIRPGKRAADRAFKAKVLTSIESEIRRKAGM